MGSFQKRKQLGQQKSRLIIIFRKEWLKTNIVFLHSNSFQLDLQETNIFKKYTETNVSL